MNEKTLVILKPDALRRKLVGEILSRFERLGLDLLAVKMITFTEELCREHYAHLAGEEFFPKIVEYMTSGPSLVLVLSGPRAVAFVRRMVGATDPLEADPGTIRGDLAVSSRKNLIHASSSLEEAVTEIARFFGDGLGRRTELHCDNRCCQPGEGSLLSTCP
ncbi:MAG: nucleoside-diphosphate kinase [Firmicutes bacterium]|nr:nucleoside-diphosphate kinase [Bacillota bacterium]